MTGEFYCNICLAFILIGKNLRRDSISVVLIRLDIFWFSKQTIIDLITIMPSYLDPILVFYCSFIDCKYDDQF